MSSIYIYDAVRTPRGVGKAKGSLYSVSPLELLSHSLRALQKRNHLQTEWVEDVTIGCVTQVNEQGACLARSAILEAGYHQSVPGVTLNRFCGSGLEAIHDAAAKVGAGFCDLVVAGGVESMSRVPMGSDGGVLFDPRFAFGKGLVPQGISADLLATLSNISRDDVDRFALESQKRATLAHEQGAFQKSLIPVVDQQGQLILDYDEGVRQDASLEALSQLKPAFEVMGKQFGLDTLTRRAYPQVETINHVHTAGNSSGIVDGSSLVLLGNESIQSQYQLKPRARIVSAVSVGDEPVLMLAGPVPAAKKALKKAKMSIHDIDLFEVNEAFAAVPLHFIRAFNLDHNKVNVNGGAIALGHPLGATGAMLLGTALDALEERDLQTALVTLCIGGGMGIATIIERV